MSTAPPPGSLGYLAEHMPVVGDHIETMIAGIYRDCALDARTRELIFLGIQTALQLPRAIGVHTTRALEAGATPDEIRWAIALALPNAGLNAVCGAFGVAQEMLSEHEPSVTSGAS